MEYLSEYITIAVIAVALIAELVHLARCRRIARLAFGPKAKPMLWTYLAVPIRVAALGAVTWGFFSLWFVVEEKTHNLGEFSENEFKHLIVAIDVSPSMRLKDAGNEMDISRRKRSSEVLQSLFDRVPMRQYRVSVVAFYSEAKAMLLDSDDIEVVRHILEELPMYHAFKPGKTNLFDGLREASKIAKPWNPGSTTVVVVTDGDTVPPTGMPEMPAAVNKVLIIGVGDPTSGSFIDGHQSRQDITTLRQVANRLRGIYHNGNQKHLSSRDIRLATENKDDEDQMNWTRREWALFAITVGSIVLALLPVLLVYFGSSWKPGVRQSAPALN